jgi:DNA polymerase, archaea type
MGIEIMYSNKLIYGKNELTRIVNAEIDGSDLVIFRELEDFTVERSVIPATFWLITNSSISPKQTKLDGSQYYKYLAEFANIEEYENLRKTLYQKRIEYYSIWDKREANLVRQGLTYYKGMKPQDVSVLSVDIESDGLVQTKNSEIYLITNTFRCAGQIHKQTFSLEDYSNQAEMLEAWCEFVREADPSLVVGHNVYGYDFGYLAHVAKLCGVTLNLGRDGSELRFNEKPSKFRKDGSQDYEYHKAYIYGREIVDTMFLSIKYDVARNFPSYGLKPIVNYLGMEKEGRTFVDAGKIKQYYNERLTNPEMWAKVKQYAEEDSDDALKLFDLMAPSFFYMTQSISKSFQEINTGATGSQINNMMVRAYLQDNHSIAKSTEAVHFEGAISFGVPKIYKNCFKVDVSSLYPSIMRQFEVYDKYKDPKRYFLELVETFTLERLKNKKLAKDTKLQSYTDLEQSQKVFINSAYGFLGATGLNYNSPPNAALVTRKGREILEKSVVFATGYDVDYWKAQAGIEVTDETSHSG